MRYTTDEIREKIVPIAEKYQLRKVYLFGSCARGDSTDVSDLDVLVDLANSTVKGWVFGGLYNDLCEIFGENVDLITMNALMQEDKRTGSLQFAENVTKERVLIYEKQ